MPPRRFRLHCLFAILLWGLSLGTQAAVLVLVPGYLGDGGSWRESGVTTVLGGAGWADGGHLGMGPRGVLVRGRSPASPRTLYTLSLPTEAPLLMQARYLTAYLDVLHKRHPDETLLLAGHSAGGVVARLGMVQNPESAVAVLITLASPHLGTQSAELGAMAGQSPLAFMAPMLGGNTLNRSQGLYRDLARERPNSLLYWLNRQQHPHAVYVSIVRKDDSLLGLGDMVVPDWSQDMNNVQALRGRSRTLQVAGGHELEGSDGALLARILSRLALEDSQGD